MIEIPPDLRWLGWLVGVDPPAGDEDALFAIGNAWNEAAAALAAQIEPLAAIRQQAAGVYTSGSGADTIDGLFGALLDGDGSLGTLAAAYRQIGDAAFDFGTSVQQAKLMMILSYALLAVEIAWAWMFPPTAPAVEAAAVNGTRSGLRRLEDLVILKIEQAILKAAGTIGKQSWMKLVVKNLSTYAVKGFVSGTQAVLMDAAVQGGQLAAGTRRQFSGNEALLSFGSSYLGSVAGRAASHWGGIGFDATLGRVVNHHGAAGALGRGAAVGTFGGVVSTLGGAVGTALHTGDWQGSFSGSGFAASMTGAVGRGAVAGGARGLVQLNQVPDGTARTGFLRHFQVDAEGNVYVPASRAEAAGVKPAGGPPPKPPALADRPAGDATPQQQREFRRLEREYARDLREYHKGVRAAQPKLEAQPTPRPDAGTRARPADGGAEGAGPSRAGAAGGGSAQTGADGGGPARSGPAGESSAQTGADGGGPARPGSAATTADGGPDPARAGAPGTDPGAGPARSGADSAGAPNGAVAEGDSTGPSGTRAETAGPATGGDSTRTVLPNAVPVTGGDGPGAPRAEVRNTPPGRVSLDGGDGVGPRAGGTGAQRVSGDGDPAGPPRHRGTGDGADQRPDDGAPPRPRPQGDGDDPRPQGDGDDPHPNRTSGEGDQAPAAPRRARALGADGPETEDRQPPWASRMSGRAEAMQERAEVAQRRADRAQENADTLQADADSQQRSADEARNTVTELAADLDRANQRLADVRNDPEVGAWHDAPAADAPPRGPARRQNHPDLEIAQNTVRMLEARHTLAEHRAGILQRGADDTQTRADNAQRAADQAQRRADDLRMVRVSRGVVDAKADAEARPAPRAITDGSWWQRALLRSEQLGKQYGTGGPGADHYQAKGTDLRGKTRPKMEKYENPIYAPYTAPPAPDETVWRTLPATRPPEPPATGDAPANEDPANEDPAHGGDTGIRCDNPEHHPRPDGTCDHPDHHPPPPDGR